MLAPFETKTLGNLNILGNIERNSTSFVYIKFNLFDFDSNKYFSTSTNKSMSLFIPIEYQVFFCLERRGL